MLPGKPRLDEHPMASEPGVVLHLWSAQAGGALFGIGYADHASADPRIMDRTRDALAGNIHGRIVEEHDSHVGTATEREFRAEGNEAMMAARLVLSGSRLYQVVVIGRKGSISPADVEMFLSSFRLSPGRSQG